MKHNHFIITLFLIIASTACSLSATASPLEGRWVKVAVSHTGIQQITPAQLREMGFDNPERVAVCGYGGVAGHTPNLDSPTTGLPVVPSMTTPDGRILFYGESSRRVLLEGTSFALPYDGIGSIQFNPASTRGYYFLTDSREPRPVSTIETTPGATLSTSHRSAVIVAPEEYNPSRSGIHFMGQNITRLPGQKCVYTLSTPRHTSSNYCRVGLRAAMKGERMRLSYALNSNRWVKSSTENSLQAETVYATLTADHIIEYNTMPDVSTLTLDGTLSSNLSLAALSQFSITYERLNLLDTLSQLPMFKVAAEPGTRLRFTEPLDDLTVWDVTDPVNPRELSQHKEGGVTDFITVAPATAPQSLVAFVPSRSFHSVESVDWTPLALPNLYTMATPQMVIVAAPALMNQAQRLASLHRQHQGLTVEVVNERDLFDLYSSGAPTPHATRRFLSDLNRRSPGTLRHLLLLGSTTWNPRAIGGGAGALSPFNVLSFPVEDFVRQGYETHSYCTDAFYGNLTESDPSRFMSMTMDINVGRIPASSIEAARGYIDKVERVLNGQSPTAHRSTALLLSDYGDGNSHLHQAEETAAAILEKSPHTTIHKEYSSFYPEGVASLPILRSHVADHLSRGPGFLYYAGHGNSVDMGSNRFLTRQLVASATHSASTMAMLATCYVYAFDREESPIATSMLLQRDGGVMSLVAAGRSVNQLFNHELALRITRAYFDHSPEVSTVGDVYRTARNNLLFTINNRELQYNTACYNLGGDPAIPLRLTTHTLNINPIESGFTPLGENIIAGSVIDSATGEVDSLFNGTLTMKLSAPAKTRHKYEIYNASYNVSDYLLPLQTASAQVTAGRFSARFSCPLVSTPGNGHRLELTAMAPDHRWAMLAIDTLRVNSPSTSQPSEGRAPEVTEMTFDPTTMTLTATIAPGSDGLSISTAIDRAPLLTVDGERLARVPSMLSPLGDGTTTLSCSLASLSAGHHEATLSVADNASRRAERSLSFDIDSPAQELSLTVDETPATHHATFSLTGEMAAGTEATLVVEDSRGRMLHTARGVTFPYIWDLRDSAGELVEDGRCRAHVKFRDGLDISSTSFTTFVVVKE